MHLQSRNFERAGLPRASAETLAEQITLLVINNKQKMEDTFVKQVALEKVGGLSSFVSRVSYAPGGPHHAHHAVVAHAWLQTILEQEARVQGFKSEMSKTQDMHQANMNKDIDRQQSYLDKMKTEVRCVRACQLPARTSAGACTHACMQTCVRMVPGALQPHGPGRMHASVDQPWDCLVPHHVCRMHAFAPTPQGHAWCILPCASSPAGTK